jgi:hypothetical protein
MTPHKYMKSGGQYSKTVFFLVNLLLLLLVFILSNMPAVSKGQAQRGFSVAQQILTQI